MRIFYKFNEDFLYEKKTDFNVVRRKCLKIIKNHHVKKSPRIFFPWTHTCVRIKKNR